MTAHCDMSYQQKRGV